MTAAVEAPVITVSRKELAIRHLLKAAARADLPMPSLDLWNGLDMLVFADHHYIEQWETFGLIRTAYGEFRSQVGPALVAFTDEDFPTSVIVTWQVTR